MSGMEVDEATWSGYLDSMGKNVHICSWVV